MLEAELADHSPPSNDSDEHVAIAEEDYSPEPTQDGELKKGSVDDRVVIV